MLFAKQDASDEEIKHVCELSCADIFIDQFPFGYDTLLYENGSNLSSGEKQRLSIARALLINPEVLILDEATSNIDNITQNCIYEILNRLRGKITCIIITHNIQNLEYYDKVVVMKDGKIVAHGKHTELLKESLYYSDFVSTRASI